jgi:hypothetical protein
MRQALLRSKQAPTEPITQAAWRNRDIGAAWELSDSIQGLFYLSQVPGGQQRISAIQLLRDPGNRLRHEAVLTHSARGRREAVLPGNQQHRRNTEVLG